MYRFTLMFSLIVFVFLASLALAGIPKLINYQGMLTNTSGEPLNGMFDTFFRIYNAPSGGDKRWEENHFALSVSQGLFNVILGSQSGGIHLDFSEEYWLEVQVEGEIMQRIEFTSVGYAYRAMVADSAVKASSAPTGGGWTDDGSVVRLESGSDSVGVGTTGPAAKLDVSGDINTSSLYRIGGDTVLSVPGYNTLVGIGAGANNLNDAGTFVGYEAGYNNSGFVCTFVGYRAGFSNQGPYNTFVGVEAGSKATGDYNSFFGYETGTKNTTGYFNTFLGAEAGFSCSTGWGNTFTGCFAGFSNISGEHNTFLGYDAGLRNDGGSGNTCIGTYAGESNTDGDYNTYLGTSAGLNNTSGSRNVFIGFQAGFHDSGSHKLYIANSSTTTPLIYGDFQTGNLGLGTTDPARRLHIVGDNPRILIEASSISPEVNFKDSGDPNSKIWALYKHGDTDDFRFYQNGDRVTIEDGTGNVGIGTTNPGTKLAVSGLTGTSSHNWLKVNTATGDFYYSSSSKRYKVDIQPLEDDFDRILQVEPRSFIDKASEQREIGYVAEEFDEMGLGNLVIYDSEGQPDGLKYELVSLYLVEVVKDLMAENEGLKQRVEILEGR